MELVYPYENRYIENSFDSYDTLMEHIQNTKALHRYFESDFGRIKPKNYCGFLSVAGQSYFIVSSDTQQDYLYLLEKIMLRKIIIKVEENGT